MTGTRKQHVARAPSGSYIGRGPAGSCSGTRGFEGLGVVEQVAGDGRVQPVLIVLMEADVLECREVGAQIGAVARLLVDQLEAELLLEEARLIAEKLEPQELAQEDARDTLAPERARA